MNNTDHERLAEIRNEMAELLEEAKWLIRSEDDFVYEQARAYWLTYIENAIDEDPDSPLMPITFGHTLRALEPEDCDEEDDDDEV